MLSVVRILNLKLETVWTVEVQRRFVHRRNLPSEEKATGNYCSFSMFPFPPICKPPAREPSRASVRDISVCTR